MNNKTILLTGGAGFIGSHLTERYIAEGYTVVVVDDLSSGSTRNLAAIWEHPNFHFYEVDICDEDKMAVIFNQHRPQIINHHAAQKSVPDSVIHPEKDVDINLHGLLTLLALIKRYPIEKFIGISSGGALAAEIIGNRASTEVELPQFTSPYAINKYAGEQYLSLYSKLYEFDWVVLRYANVYGPRQIADGECGVVPIFVNNLIANKESILMTYADMPRGCTRDYVYVTDIIDSNLLVTKIDKPLNGCYNIASNIELAMLDIYEALLAEWKSTLPIKIQSERIGDVKRSILNNTKAKQELGWQPQVDFKTGITMLYNWYQKQ